MVSCLFFFFYLLSCLILLVSKALPENYLMGPSYFPRPSLDVFGVDFPFALRFILPCYCASPCTFIGSSIWAMFVSTLW